MAPKIHEVIGNRCTELNFVKPNFFKKKRTGLILKILFFRHCCFDLERKKYRPVLDCYSFIFFVG